VRIGQPILWPLSLPYAAAAQFRAAVYKSRIVRPKHLAATVISVGNLTVGGTGKTPMVLWIAQRLLAEGRRPGILTRGYRGHATNSTDSAQDGAGAASTSDEVQLLKGRLGPEVAFGVGANRFVAGRELLRRGVDWFILDDGFQHLQLARDVNILLIDATDPFGGGRVLPAGRLREPRPALARADIIVITRSVHAPAVEALIRRYSQAPIFYAFPRPLPVRFARGEYPGREDGEALSKRLFAFCGIGNPHAFLADLRNWGFHITACKFFPDHYHYAARDIQKLEQHAVASGAEGLICTEKDIFNLGEGRAQAVEIRYCPISLQVSDAEGLWRAIETTAEARKAAFKQAAKASRAFVRIVGGGAL
jgi:tetraacyldisaccharide 4'-kinase